MDEYDRCSKCVNDGEYEKIDTVTLDSIWKRSCQIINRLPQEHAIFICALIFHHYFSDLKSKSTPSNIKESIDEMKLYDYKKTGLQPYGIHTMTSGKGVIVLANNLPITLQCIIIAYIENITKIQLCKKR